MYEARWRDWSSRCFWMSMVGGGNVHAACLDLEHVRLRSLVNLTCVPNMYDQHWRTGVRRTCMWDQAIMQVCTICFSFNLHHLINQRASYGSTTEYSTNLTAGTCVQNCHRVRVFSTCMVKRAHAYANDSVTSWWNHCINIVETYQHNIYFGRWYLHN
jgi:hypothetical protein